MSVTLDRNDAASEIRLEGRVNIESASELKLLLAEELSSGRHMRVDLTKATELDVCILQLLLGAAREWARIESSFTLAGPLLDELSESIARAGFDALQITSDQGILSEV